jgi:hypothetical protein
MPVTGIIGERSQTALCYGCLKIKAEIKPTNTG